MQKYKDEKDAKIMNDILAELDSEEYESQCTVMKNKTLSQKNLTKLKLLKEVVNKSNKTQTVE